MANIRVADIAHGRSGDNIDYVLSTVAAIEAQGFRDAPLHKLAAALRTDASASDHATAMD